jgi:Bacterial regulatory proteins, luxR family
MIRNTLRTLWAEPRPRKPPGRVWRDWALVGVLLVWSVLETVLREDPALRPLALTVHISISTVKTHLASLMRKLNARNRVEIAMWAYETGRVRG